MVPARSMQMCMHQLLYVAHARLDRCGRSRCDLEHLSHPSGTADYHFTDAMLATLGLGFGVGQLIPRALGINLMGFNAKIHVSLVINLRFNSRFNSI